MLGQFKVCKSMHHRIIHINHQPDATIFQFIILTFIYSSTCFGRSPAHHHELSDCSSSLWFYRRIVMTVVLCSWSGRPARPWTQYGYYHNTKVKPEAATAVTEFMMMGERTPETCWAVNKRQDSTLENSSILVYKSQQDADVTEFIFIWELLYMFRASLSLIFRSTKQL
jgi:hypothetical protein